MSGHNTPYHMYQGPLLVDDPGDAGTIVIDRYGALVPLVSGASGETRTLATPTKAGIFASLALDVDGGGDVTVTVTGGYNRDGDLTIVLYDAGDYVSFMSVKVGTNYRWRVVGIEGSRAVSELLAADEVETANLSYKISNLDEHGPGLVGTVFEPRTYRYTRNSTIITEVHIDLTGLDSSGVANDVIGLNTGGAAYLGRNVVATNGIIYRVEMTCLELPATGDADIILVQGSAADEAFDDTVADSAAICDSTGDWVASKTIVNNAPAITANYYYYLTQGATDDATYTAGQFLIRFYGHALFVA